MFNQLQMFYWIEISTNDRINNRGDNQLAVQHSMNYKSGMKKHPQQWLLVSFMGD